MKAILTLGLLLLIARPAEAAENVRSIDHDAARKTIIISDGSGAVRLQIRYQDRCIVDRLELQGDQILSKTSGIRSSLVATGSTVAVPSSYDVQVQSDDRKVVIAGIRPEQSPASVTETWTFEPQENGINWTISRTVASPLNADDAFMPEWRFADISDWTGALLGTGGVAWFALFDSAHATYGVHTSEALLWSQKRGKALRLAARSLSGERIALRFTRRANNELSIGFTASPQDVVLKYDEGLHRRRYLPAREDIWAPQSIQADTSSIELKISAADVSKRFDPGDLRSFNAKEIQMIANTVARIGVIDTRLHGGNSWRTPYGPICLHEQYIAQLGLIMQDTNYFNDYRQTLDYYRDHAILADGRVKSRWAYNCEDAMPGTCDSLGFYEAQWGYLLDSNPDFVINVAELFDFTGDSSWVRTHKSGCERALDYMLRRDTDGNGLVEVMTDSHKEKRGSDWIDVIWASYENAFVNATMYRALTVWAAVEDHLGDNQRAQAYRAKAAALKSAFNRPADKGGFWSNDHQWYIHWRDKDSSIHGDNLVTFVNFMAIAYGICDDTARSNAILQAIEKQMQKEDLFFWPICMFTYAPGEGIDFEFPFPSYENGDIFLSLGELGVCAYKNTNPAIPVKYLKRLIARYERDGLAFQRYLRANQEGAGDDILAGNALPIVGLYRDIYGIQPKYNRLYLEPHVTPELDGTVVNYTLREQFFQIRPRSSGKTSMSANGFSITSTGPFGMWSSTRAMDFFAGSEERASLTILRADSSPLAITVGQWDRTGIHRWSENIQQASAQLKHTVNGLKPLKAYVVLVDGKTVNRGNSNAAGSLAFNVTLAAPGEHAYELHEDAAAETNR